MNWQQPVEAVRVALGDGRGLLVAVRDLEGREGSAEETIAHAGLADDALDLVAEFSILLSLALSFFLGLAFGLGLLEGCHGVVAGAALRPVWGPPDTIPEGEALGVARCPAELTGDRLRGARQICHGRVVAEDPVGAAVPGVSRRGRLLS